MKVVRVIARLNIGGPARHVLLLERHLRQLGYQSVLVYGVPAEREGELPPDADLACVGVAELGRAVRFGSDVVAFWKLLRILFRERPDIVHTHTAKAGALGRLAAFVYNRTRRRVNRCVVVHTFHGHVLRGYFGPAATRAARLAERMLARLSDRIVAISEGQRRDLVEVLRIAPAGKVVVVPLGLDLDALAGQTGNGAGIRREAGFADDAVVCGYVGRLVPIKHLELLIDGCAQAFDAVPDGRLLVVGDGECRAALERRAAERGVRAKVHFAGWRSDLTDVYGAMTIVALTSRNEGTPVALIEAMAAGRAVIATAVGAVPDVVRDDETGWLVPDNDVDRLSAGLVRLLREPATRERLGASARPDVLARFGYRRLVHDIDVLYRDAVSERRAGRPSRD